MSLVGQINLLATRIANEFDAVRTEIGGGGGGGLDLLAVPISRPGLQSTFTMTEQIPVPFDCTLEAIVLRLATAPTGATTFKVDVNYDGVTIFGTQTNRPIWVASANLATVGAASVTSFLAGHYWSWDVDAIGSTVAGSGLNGWMLCRAT